MVETFSSIKMERTYFEATFKGKFCLAKGEFEKRVWEMSPRLFVYRGIERECIYI